MAVYPHRHDNAAPVYEDKDGKYWVSHADLLANDYANIEDFDIVYLNGKFWELQGYAEKPNAWWVEPVVGEVPDAPPQDTQETEAKSA